MYSMNACRKAQGLPITTIVIAVLALLVLVITGAIFGGQIFKFGLGASTCQSTCIYTQDKADVYLQALLGGKAGPTERFESVFASTRLVTDDKGCNDGEQALTGRYIARYVDGVDPKNHPAFTCKACCVYGG